MKYYLQKMSAHFFVKTKGKKKKLCLHSNFSLDIVFNLMFVRSHTHWEVKVLENLKPKESYSKVHERTCLVV